MDRIAVRRRALATVAAFGVVSLLADIVYEGARSILGPYLLVLGASATAVGLVSGVGEFVGYALRFVMGAVADRRRAYWTMTFAGYGLTIVAVPLLGWTGRVDLALALVVAERLGKAIRSPARDVLLAEAAEPLGRGWGFGIHEAMDQIGAVAGPLLLAAVLALRGSDYRLAFSILAVPGLLALIALVAARRMGPHPADDVPAENAGRYPRDGRRRIVKAYLVFVALSALGFAPFPLVAFHLTARSIVDDPVVPMMFALAMAVDAVTALVAGRRYDTSGLRVLLVLPVMSVAVALSFAGTPLPVWFGVAAWGAVMGIQESTLRAVVGDLASSANPATAYGGFYTVYGGALLTGGILLGLAYDRSVVSLVAIIVATQLGAAAVLWSIMKKLTMPASG